MNESSLSLFKKRLSSITLRRKSNVNTPEALDQEHTNGGKPEQDVNNSGADGHELPAGGPAIAIVDVAPAQSQVITPPQIRKSSYTTLRPLLDGIRGIMDNILTEGSTKPGPDPANGFSQASPWISNNAVPDSKQRRPSLAAATRYSNLPDEGDSDNIADTQSSKFEDDAGPATMLPPTASAAVYGQARSQRLTAEGLPYEPIKWQVPESLWNQQIGSSSSSRISAAKPASQQLSWTPKGSPPSKVTKQQPAGKQATAMGRKKGPKMPDSTVRQQENRSSLGAQPRSDTAQQSTMQISSAHVLINDGTATASSAEAGDTVKSRRASLVQLQMRVRSRHAARRSSILQSADMAADMAQPDALSPSASPAKVPHLHLPHPNEVRQRSQQPSVLPQKARAKGKAAGAQRVEQPSNFSIPAWREGDTGSPPAATDLTPCSTCGRTFNAQALAIHGRICVKVFASKRKTSSGTAMDVEGSQIMPGQRKTSSSENASGAAKAGDKASKWKMQSAQLRLAMKALQGDSLAVAALTAEANRALVPCPHCGRSYSEIAAERHIPKCADIVHKPQRLLVGGGSGAHVRVGRKR